MDRKAGQAGLDFLMTYGWALLIIVLVIGVLFALGIFNVSSFTGNRAAGFAQVGVAAWKLTPGGTFTVQLTNRVGTTINITGMNYTFDNMASSAASTASANNTANGKTTATLTVASGVTGYNSGDPYSVKLDIYYTDLKTGFTYADSGTLTGKATN